MLSLLAPIQYTLTFIPLLPAQLIDYIQVSFLHPLHSKAPTPYLIGIYSPTLAKHAFDADAPVLLVHLDFDKVFLSFFFLFFPAHFPCFRGYPTPPYPPKRPPHRHQASPLYLPAVLRVTD